MLNDDDDHLPLHLSLLDHEYSRGLNSSNDVSDPCNTHLQPVGQDTSSKSDHDYCLSDTSMNLSNKKKTVKNVLKHRLKTHTSTVSFITTSKVNTDRDLNLYQQAKLKLTLCRTKNIKKIVSAFMSSSNIRQAVLDDISVQLGKIPSTMRNKKHGFVSILMKKDPTSLQSVNLGHVVQEMNAKFPELLQILLHIMVPENKLEDDAARANLIPKLALIYGILMQSRHHELSLMQRLVAMTLADNICDQAVRI